MGITTKTAKEPKGKDTRPSKKKRAVKVPKLAKPR